MGSDPKDDEPTVLPGPGPTETVDLGAAAPDPGLLAGRYRIEHKLSEGGIGVVYRARDEHLDGRPVVIKILLERSTGSDWLRRKFADERRALVRLNDPNIVVAFDAGTLPNGQAFLVMELVPGSPLRERLRAGALPLEMTADIVSQIGRALTAAHGHGIHHRDLKPENVMIQELGDGRPLVKIIDFGIATVKESEDASTHMTQVAGTLRYMAPEQLEGKPGAASDTYALATMAYEMLTGTVPFKTDNAVELHKRQLEGPKVLPSALRRGLSSAVDAAILKGLAFEAKARHASSQQFAAELARALATLPRDVGPDDHATRAITRADTPPLPAPAPRSKSYALWAGGAALIVALAVFVYERNRPAERTVASVPAATATAMVAATAPSATPTAGPAAPIVARETEAPRARITAPVAAAKKPSETPGAALTQPTDAPPREATATPVATPTAAPTNAPVQVAAASPPAASRSTAPDAESIASPADRKQILDLVTTRYPVAMGTRKASSVRAVFPRFSDEDAKALSTHKKLTVRVDSCGEPLMQSPVTATLTCKRLYEATMPDGHVQTIDNTAIFFLTKDAEGAWAIGALSK